MSNNTVEDYGDEDTETGCAIYFHTSEGLSFVGNTIIRPGRAAVLWSVENRDFNASSNTIVDPWSSAEVALGFNFAGNYNTGYVGGNVFAVNEYTGGVKTYELSKSDGIALRVNIGLTGTIIELGSNYSEAGIYTNEISGYLLRGTTQVATSGAGEDDLCSQVIPVNKFQVGERLRIIAAGTKTGGAGNKTIKFYFGSTAVTFNAAANDTNDWRFQGEIIATTNTAQRFTWVGFNGTTITQGYDTASETLTSGVTIKLTGECADAGDTITQTIFLVEKF